MTQTATSASASAPGNARTFWWSLALVTAAAAWVTYQARGTINNDGILYIEAAWFFAKMDWAGGIATYNWPLYSLLVAAVHNITGLTLQTSAHVLDIAFVAAAAGALFTLVRELGGGNRAIAWAAALLLATPYLFGDIVPMVLRDHGFWACHLWSLVFLLRFATTGSWPLALWWGALATAAVLFRIEGITYLVAAPAVLLLGRERSLQSRLKEFAFANILLVAVAVALIAALLHPAVELSDMGRLGDPVIVAQAIMHQLSSGLAERAEIIGQQVLGNYLDDFGTATLLLGMGYIVLFKTATSAGILQTSLVAARWRGLRDTLTPVHRNLLIWVVALGLINATLILFKGFILPKRLLIPVGFVMIVFAAITASQWFDGLLERRTMLPRMHKAMAVIAATLLVGQLVAALRPSSPRIAFEIEAADWVRRHTSDDQTVHYETPRLAYYVHKHAHPEQDWSALGQTRWRDGLDGSPPADGAALPDPVDYTYLVFITKKKDREAKVKLIDHLGNPLATFDGPRGKQALVFAGHASERSSAQ